MGAIQNSINSAFNSVAAASVVVGHEKEVQEAKNLKAAELTSSMQKESIDNNQQLLDNVAETTGKEEMQKADTQRMKEASQSLKDFKNEKHSRYSEGEKKGKFMSKEDKKKEIKTRRHDLAMMRKAISERETQITGLKAQRQMIQSTILAHSKKNEIYKRTLGKNGYKEPADVQQSSFYSEGGKK